MNENSKAPVFFSGKSIGKSLREIAVDLIQTENDDLISRWFHSDAGTDLYTWIDSHQIIIKQQISFNGQVVEWNCLEGIRTGVVIESELAESKKSTVASKAEDSIQSDSILFDGKPMSKSVDLALEILHHLVVEEPFLVQLIGNFENPQDIQSMAPQDFISRFGIAVKNSQSFDTGFWDQIKNRFNAIFKKAA
jgi:hypothetical protein